MTLMGTEHRLQLCLLPADDALVSTECPAPGSMHQDGSSGSRKFNWLQALAAFQDAPEDLDVTLHEAGQQLQVAAAAEQLVRPPPTRAVLSQ